MSRLAAFWRAREGAAAIEAAFILPVLLMLLLGLMEIGRMAWVQSALNYSVQEAARCAIVRHGDLCQTSDQIAAFAVQRASPLTIPAADIAVTQQACGTQVSAAVPYRFLLWAVAPKGPTIRAQACRA
jgi:Flp pilus assembly protein TadG